MKRRNFLAAGAALLAAASAPAWPRWGGDLHESSSQPPAFAVVPVVGDGKWILPLPANGNWPSNTTWTGIFATVEQGCRGPNLGGLSTL